MLLSIINYLSNSLLYRPVYSAKSEIYEKRHIVCRIKLCKMAAVSTLLLPVQSHSGFTAGLGLQPEPHSL